MRECESRAMSQVDVRTIEVLSVLDGVASTLVFSAYCWYPACFGFFCSVIGYLNCLALSEQPGCCVRKNRLQLRAGPGNPMFWMER